MARRIAPEFNVTRIMRPVTAPVDTFYNLAPLAQTAPVDTQSLEIAEALRELSPSLMGMAQAMHSRETRLGVEDATAMTPEERKAFMQLEADKQGIMPQRTIATLQEIARQQYVMEYRRQALAAVPQMSEPYNPDGTVRTADSAILTLQGIADGLNVPNSYYIRRAFADGKRAVDDEIMARVAEGQVNKAQQKTDEQVVTRFMEIFQTTQDPEQIAKRFGEASDQLRQAGLLTDGGRLATYTALSGMVTALAKSPRLEEADIDRISAVISMVMEPQVDEQGRAYRGVRGMPLPPELYAQYENLQNSLDDLYATADTRNQEQAIEQYKFQAIDSWTTYVYSPEGPLKPDPIAQRQWIADNFPNLSGTQLAALNAFLNPQMSAIVAEKLKPPIGVDQDTMANLEFSAMRGELTPEAVYGNRNISLEQRTRLLSMVNEGPFSAPNVQAEIAQVSKQIESLRFSNIDLSTLSQETGNRLQSQASELILRYVRELSREISQNSELMQLRVSDPYEYAEQVSGLLAGISDKVQKAMSDDLNKAREESEYRIRAAVDQGSLSNAKSYAEAAFALVPDVDPLLVAQAEQEYRDAVFDEFVDDPRPFFSKIGSIGTDFHVRALARLTARRAREGLQPYTNRPSDVISRLNDAVTAQDQVDYTPDVTSLVFKDLPEGQGLFGRFFTPAPAYTATGFLQSTGLHDLVEDVTNAYLAMEASSSVSDINAWKKSQAALQKAVEAVDFQAPTRDFVVRVRGETGIGVKTIAVPVFQFRPDGIYTLKQDIEGVARGPLPESIASRLDDQRVKDPEAMAFYMSWKQRNFGSLDQLTSLQTDEGIVISRGIEDAGTIQFDPRKTRFFNSRQELTDAINEYMSAGDGGPLQIILEYTEYRIAPSDLIQAQEDLIYMQIP